MTNTDMPYPPFASMVDARHRAWPVDARAAADAPAWIAFNVANVRVEAADMCRVPVGERLGSFAGADGKVWIIVNSPLPREGVAEEEREERLPVRAVCGYREAGHPCEHVVCPETV